MSMDGMQVGDDMAQCELVGVDGAGGEEMWEEMPMCHMEDRDVEI